MTTPSLDILRDSDQLLRAAELLKRGDYATVRAVLRGVGQRVDEVIRYQATTGHSFPRPRSVV